MKSKATGCGSISTVFSRIVLLCISSIIIIIIIIITTITIIIIIIKIIIIIGWCKYSLDHYISGKIYFRSGILYKFLLKA